MKKRFLTAVSLVIAGVLLAGPVFCLELRSGSFSDGGLIPAEYTYRGGNVSPQLAWSDAPEGTRSFVLIMDDPDAPIGEWIHWVVYDIPPTATGLNAGVPQDPQLTDGTKQGINSFRMIGYGGPSPPPGPAHRYIFTLYALDTVLQDMPPAANKGDVLRAIQGHILGQTTLTGMFGRK